MIKKGNILSIAVIVSLVIIICLYLIYPDASININRIMEMLFTDDYKGILMYYYEYGELSYIISIAANTLQILVPPLFKSALIKANIRYFGSDMGLIFSLLGIVLGLFYSYGIGRTLRIFIFNRIVKYKNNSEMIINKYGGYLVFLLCTMIAWPYAFIGYASGLLLVDWKKFMFASITGKIIILVPYSMLIDNQHLNVYLWGIRFIIFILVIGIYMKINNVRQVNI